MADYFVAIDGQQQGPFPTSELMARGMRADSLVWCDGMGDWQRADTVAELAPLLARPSYPPPPPPPPANFGPPVAPQQQYAAPANYGPPGQQVYSPSGFVQTHFGPPPVSYAGVPPYNPADSKRVAAGLCGIFLGALGIHKFILGLNGAGTVMLLISILTCGFGAWIPGIIGFIEGIIYLSKSDPEFYQAYVVERRGWF